MATFELTKGQKYRVLHKSESQRYTRESVLVLLDRDGNELIFDARPVAGTQKMPVSWVIGIWPSAEPIKINGRFQ